MPTKSNSADLLAAKKNKNDEFYTQLPDIEKELNHYEPHFKGKVVYCNCDDPRVSNFFHYFSYNFEELKLKKLISACYKNQDRDIFSQHLQDDEQAKILDYKITVYLCSGSDSEKLRWFRTINIVGEKLTDQELRNAVYSGSWVTDAKRYFSKTGCAAYGLGSDYLKGSANRQDYLETAIKWISENDIERYMGEHQQDANASALWRYFQDVVTWVKSTFTTKRSTFMKGVDWGNLYNKYKDEVYDSKQIEEQINELILDDDVTKKSGIYPYILTRDEKHLTFRAFTDAMKQKVYEKQKGICKKCKKESAINDMEADHITPWHEGGKTLEENCQMLCKDCNRRKSGK